MVSEKKLLDFNGAIDAIDTGKKVTREEWGDVRHYCLMKDNLLQLHKAGESEETIRPWIISSGDIAGEDWYVL